MQYLRCGNLWRNIGKKLDVAELRFLRWMSGVSKLDIIMNERIRWTTKVGDIQESAGK